MCSISAFLNELFFCFEKMVSVHFRHTPRTVRYMCSFEKLSLLGREYINFHLGKFDHLKQSLTTGGLHGVTVCELI